MQVRRISFFWAQGADHAPDLVKRCWDGWAALNPGWEIAIGDTAQARSVFDALRIAAPPVTLQGQADIFRVHDIAAHGGIYVDAATIPIRPLDDWLPALAGQGFFAFHDPYRKRSIENWFLYSDPGAVLTERWLDQIRRYWSVTRRPQVARRELDRGLKGDLACWMSSARMALSGRDLKAKSVIEPRDRVWAVAPDGGGARPVHPYFWPHYLFDHMLQTDPEARAAWSAVPKQPSYKSLMLRHWKKSYAQMTERDVETLVAGSVMQKLALNTPPPQALLNKVFAMAGL
ncbi:glycosyltransferase family 32 protein [Primorskyibacter sp. 2E107]|uniref:glycosyltransferase family 32 protein n=1 Tax=Primorskyibacter sp. 2E107 TaxID=3403458 RepID=UPI003AF61210